MGFDGVVTGHYARTRETDAGRTLHRAVDPLKDQSYVLAVLNREQVNGAIFPLGDTEKVDIRKEAAQELATRGEASFPLPTERMEQARRRGICF